MRQTLAARRPRATPQASTHMLTLRIVRIVLPTLDRAACGSRVAALLDTWQRELAYAAPGGPGPAGSVAPWSVRNTSSPSSSESGVEPSVWAP